MPWLNFLICKCDGVICDAIHIYKHGTYLLTNDDKILIKALRSGKEWSALTMMREFPLRKWKSTLRDLIKRIDETRKIETKMRPTAICKNGSKHSLNPKTGRQTGSLVCKSLKNMGGATVLKGGHFCERSELKKILTPTFWPVGGQNIA